MMFPKVRRSVQNLRFIIDNKFIGLGIWVTACIIIYRVGIAQKIRSATNSIVTIEHGATNSPHRIFNPNKPKLVILLAYQRVGSSFTGQIFNQNPELFYIFEPLDGIYSAMYGTKEGFTVPSDIAFFPNGSIRQMPQSEFSSVADALGSIFTCEFDNVPAEVLAHRFMSLFKRHHKRLGSYIQCFQKNNISIHKCRAYIKDICPTRFGSDPDKELYCKNVMWTGRKDIIESAEHTRSFQLHFDCIKSLRTNLAKCMHLINFPCFKSKVRVAKTVRLSMATAEYMLSQFSNLRIIHLIRDPRAVALSRMGQPTFRGMYSGRSIPKEAQLYCNEVLRDIHVRKRIEQRFPGSVMQVIYEDLVENSTEQTKLIYDFLNETMPAEVKKWILDNTEGAVKNSSVIAEHWQTELTFKAAKEVSDACSDLYNAINYRWPV